MNPPNWISNAQSLGLLTIDFAPFRIIDGIQQMADGTIVALWRTWIINDRGNLQGFRSDPEKIDDWELLGPDQAENLSGLNRNEEIDYQDRIKHLSLTALREQRKLWQELQNRAPMTTGNLGLTLTYPPLVILSHEIQEKIADSVQTSGKAAASAKPLRGKKRKSKSAMRIIYNSLVVFHGNKRREYERLHGTPYGAAKYADEQTVKEIWRLHRVKVSPRNVRDAMSRN